MDISSGCDDRGPLSFEELDFIPYLDLSATMSPLPPELEGWNYTNQTETSLRQHKRELLYNRILLLLSDCLLVL